MRILQEKIIQILTEEHEDWIKSIRSATENNEGIDLNLGGNFAKRVAALLQAFDDYEERKNKKSSKKLFG